MKKQKVVPYLGDGGAFGLSPDAWSGITGAGAGLMQSFDNPNRPNYGSKIGGGLLSGAAAGASLGPLGMAGGALIGGVSGLLGANKQRKQLDDYFNQMEQQRQKAFASSMNMDTSGQFKTGAYFPYMEMGGVIDAAQASGQPVVNIEHGEMLVNLQKGRGDIIYKYFDDGKQFNGKNPLTGEAFEPHKTKGKDPRSNFVPVPSEGDFVVPVKYAKKYEQAYNNNDKVTLATIKQNIDNEIKANPNGQKVSYMKQGGKIVRYLGEGGDPDYPTSKGEYWDQWNDTMDSWDAAKATGPIGLTSGLPQKGINPSMGVNLPLPGSQPINGLAMPKGTMAESKGFNFGSKLNQLGVLAPTIYSLGKGLGGYDREPEKTKYISPYLSKSLNNLPQELDYNRYFDKIFEQQNVGIDNINNSTNNAGIRRSNIQNLVANTNGAIGDTFLQGEQYNNQVRSQRSGAYMNAAQYDSQAEAQNNSYNMNARNTTAANRGARDNAMYAGLSGISNKLQMNELTKNQKISDSIKAQTIGGMFGNYQMNPAIQALIGGNMTQEEALKMLQTGVFNFKKPN